MAKTVFILGAGASAAAGGPLVRDFLSTAQDLLRAGAVGREYADDFAQVFEAQSELQYVHSKAALDIENLETVFAAFEMASIATRLGAAMPADVVEILPSLMQRVIARTLELRIHWRPRPEGVSAPHPYDAFARLIRDMARPGMGAPDVAILTFNYDLALDYALGAALSPSGFSIDYCLEPPVDRGVRPPETVDLVKLHGSLNWATCAEENCAQVIPWKVMDFIKTKAPFQAWTRAIMSHGAVDPKSVGPLRLEIGSALSELTHCDRPCEKAPVIVPPTWSKTQHYPRIRNVWSRAASHLHGAENIIVIGYSLAPMDQSFHYLYALGTISPTLLRRFWVFDPNAREGGELDLRYRSRLGAAALTHYLPFQESFESAIPLLRKPHMLDIPEPTPR